MLFTWDLVQGRLEDTSGSLLMSGHAEIVIICHTSSRRIYRLWALSCQRYCPKFLSRLVGKSSRTCPPQKNRLPRDLSPVSDILLSYSSIRIPSFPQTCFSGGPTALSLFILTEHVYEVSSPTNLGVTWNKEVHLMNSTTRRMVNVCNFVCSPLTTFGVS